MSKSAVQKNFIKEMIKENQFQNVGDILNVNEFLYHLTSNLFTSNDTELVCHF